MNILATELKTLKSLAWSFHVTTGLDWFDLYQEATLAYLEVLNETKSEYKKGIAFVSAKNHLINYIKWNYERNLISIEGNEIDIPYTIRPFFELYQELGNKSKKIADMIISNPHYFIAPSPKEARGLVYRKLREKGWKWKDIWNGFDEIKYVLNEIDN